MPKQAVTRTRTGNLKTVARSGEKGGTPLFVRMTPDERKEFDECVLVDAELHSGEANATVVIRRLIRAFCKRTREVEASPEGREAAKVLRKKASA